MKRLIFICWLLPHVISAQNSLILTEEKQGILAFYQQNPFDINQVEEAELIALGILELHQITAFLLHRKQIGRFLSIYELQTIQHWDIATLRTLQPLMTCKSKPTSWLQPENTKNQIILRTERTLEQKKGFSEPTSRSKVRFIGNPYSTLFRYRSTWNSNMRGGILISKDVGEHNYLDFSSGFVELRDRKGYLKLILGDYINQWGQGLIQSGSFSLGKSYESIRATQKFHGGALAYTSSGESEFYRGINLQSNFKKIQSQFYFSVRKKDLILSKDSSYFRSFQLDGLHRTPTEISQLNGLKEHAAGANIRFVGKYMDLALAQTWTHWNYRFQPSNPLDWRGNRLINSSLSYIHLRGNIRISGEIAHMARSTWATVQAVTWAKNKKTDVSGVFRVYEAGYFSPMANAISESSSNKNEMGLFLGHQYQLNKYQRISSYLDVFRFPKANTSQWAEGQMGWELLSRFQWDRRKQGHYFAQIKWTHKYLKSQNFGIIAHNLYQSSIDWDRPFRHFEWHGRFMWSHIQSKEQQESGYLLLNDFNLHLKRFKIQMRTAWIWSGSYDTRLYAYEPSLPFSFLLPAYYDPSTRNVCLIEFKGANKLSIALKLARTDYFQKEEIGSGLDAIQGSHKTDVGIQLVYSP